MNIVWTSVILFGLGLLVINNIDLAMTAILDGGGKAVSLVIKLWGIYAIWLGLLKIVEETGLDQKVAKLLSPIIKIFVGKTDSYTSNQIAINLTSNILGMGNASTPSGMNAIEGLERLQKSGKYATASMIMILILNATSLQLIPTTVIGLRTLAGSNRPTDIIIPTLLVSLVNTALGVILVKIFSKIFKDRHE